MVDLKEIIDKAGKAAWSDNKNLTIIDKFGHRHNLGWLAVWHMKVYLTHGESMLVIHRNTEGSATLRICYPGLKQKNNSWPKKEEPVTM